MARIRVLVVDDSPICRALLREALEHDGDILVVAEAGSGDEAVQRIRMHRPDVVTLDLRMPGMDGLAVVEWTMASSPRPILVLSELVSGRANEVTFEALRRGALEVACKPDGADAHAALALRRRVRALAKVPVVRHLATRAAKQMAPPSAPKPPPVEKSVPAYHAGATMVIALGASAGGPAALAEVIAALPRKLPASVGIVQHLPSGFAASFAQHLESRTARPVRIASGRIPVAAGQIVLAPDDAHLELGSDDTWRVATSAPRSGHRPSVDVLLESVARARGHRAVGVVLTGMGRDGADGLAQMRARGALTIAQDEATSAVFGMPRAAAEAGAVEIALALHDIAPAIARAARGGSA